MIQGGHMKWSWIEALSALLLVSCGTGQIVPSSTKSVALIKQEWAINNALEIARSSQPEIGPAQTDPTNLQAELMSLADAQNQLNIQDEIPSGYLPGQPVWLISMDGIWADETPCQQEDCQFTPPPYHHYAIIMDARTGLEIEGSYRP
jgi:hypothetical protein